MSILVHILKISRWFSRECQGDKTSIGYRQTKSLSHNACLFGKVTNKGETAANRHYRPTVKYRRRLLDQLMHPAAMPDKTIRP